MEWEQLKQLRELVQSDAEFDKIWDFFFDHFGSNEQFAKAGQLASAALIEELTTLLEGIYNRMLNRHVMIAQLLLTEVPGQRFFHGPCVTDAGIGCVLYFEDLRMGMVSLSAMQGDNLVHYARFTTIPVPDKHFTFTPRRRETSH
jgi:hypothetical protein